MYPTGERATATIMMAFAVVFTIGIIATDDGLIGWKDWLDSPRVPENEYERVVKQWADHLPESERKWEWYLNGQYSEIVFVDFISNHLVSVHSITPPAKPDPLTEENFYEFMLLALELHPTNHTHR